MFESVPQQIEAGRHGAFGVLDLRLVDDLVAPALHEVLLEVSRRLVAALNFGSIQKLK